MKLKLIIIFIISLIIIRVSSYAQTDISKKIFSGHKGTILSVDANETQKYLVTGSYDTDVILWDYSTGMLLKKFTEHDDGVWTVKISPDSKYVATGSWDNNANSVGGSLNCLKIFDLETFEEIKSLSIYPDRYIILKSYPELDRFGGNGIRKLSYNADGSKIAAVTRSSDLFIWDIENNFERKDYIYSNTKHRLLGLSPDWKYIVCRERKRKVADTNFYLMNLESNDVVVKFDYPKRNVVQVFISWNMKYIAVISGKRTEMNEIDVWEFTTGKLLYTLKGHSNVVRSIAFSKNNMFMATAAEDNEVKLWDIQNGELLASFTENLNKELTSVIFSPDQKKLISGSQDWTIKFWNIERFINR